MAHDHTRADSQVHIRSNGGDRPGSLVSEQDRRLRRFIMARSKVDIDEVDARGFHLDQRLAWFRLRLR